jgi:ATP-dependent protease ClpP protease subunit
MKNFKPLAIAQTDAGAEIFLYDEIGFWGTNANDFRFQLDQLGGRPLTLRINSPGGSITDGMAMMSLLRDYKGEITVKIDGIAASMASVVAMVGKRVLIAEGAVMMVHMPLYGNVSGNADDLRQMANDLEAFTPGIVAAYVAKTGQSEETVRGWMQAERYFSAKDAVANKLADELIPTAAKPEERAQVDGAHNYKAMSFLNQIKHVGAVDSLLVAAGYEFTPEAITGLIAEAKAGRDAKALLDGAAAEIESANKLAEQHKATADAAKAEIDKAKAEAAAEIAKATAELDAKASLKAADLLAAQGHKAALPNSPAANGKSGDLFAEYQALLAKDPKAAATFYRANKAQMFA